MGPIVRALFNVDDTKVVCGDQITSPWSEVICPRSFSHLALSPDTSV
jgi:hypothetical protein